MTFDIPKEILNKLSTLYHAPREAEESMAACTLHAWLTHFDQPCGGISAPAELAAKITHFEADPTAKTQSVYSPVFVWKSGATHLFAFSDQSALVACQKGELITALPSIFRLRKESKHPFTCVPVIRSLRTAEAKVSFRQQKADTKLPAFAADDPALNEFFARDALNNLEADLDHLSELFGDLPRIVQTHRGHPDNIQDGICLPFLPQVWFTGEEIRQTAEWAQDMAHWIAIHLPQYRDICVILRTRKPSQDGKPHVLIGPIEVHYTETGSNRSGWTDIETIFDDHAFEDFFADPAKAQPPIPQARLYSLQFKKSGARGFKVSSPTVCNARSSGHISNHIRLRVLSRFGAPKPTLVE